jgi:hypothetical protein
MFKRQRAENLTGAGKNPALRVAFDSRLKLEFHGAKLIKIGAKVVRHSKKVVFQMAEVAVPRELFWSILEGIGRLRLSVAASG